jgi:predicted phage baseplate assembly protein
MLTQDPRAALAALGLGKPGGPITWHVRADLLASGPDDRDFVCEIDNERIAHLRFGDGELGRQPDVGSTLTARYRVGAGKSGNVGAEAIACVVLKDQKLDGIEFTIRNPLPARGGIEPEPMAEAQLFAPAAFRKQIARAITADDYAALAALDKRLQRAHARFIWTGSWYEADVSVDPSGREFAASSLLHDISGRLHRYRRMGHDLCVQRAVYVPLSLKLDVCALPGYDRGHIKSALLTRFGARAGSRGVLGFFHPDRLSFGDGIYLSQIVAAAMAVPGVECVTVIEFHRSFESLNHEIENGVLPLASHEIAQLDNDPNHPERGQLDIAVRGGR